MCNVLLCDRCLTRTFHHKIHRLFVQSTRSQPFLLCKCFDLQPQRRRLLTSRAVNVSRSSNRIVVTLSSLKLFFFNGLTKAVHFSDGVGASDPGIQEERGQKG